MDQNQIYQSVTDQIIKQIESGAPPWRQPWISQGLGLPRNALGAARAMARCRPRQLDVGLAGDEPFLMMVSAGLDAAVMTRQNSAAKARSRIRSMA